MRLTYITRVDISSTAAQARQIQSMARAFHNALDNDFLLVCSGTVPSASDIPHRSFPFSKLPKLRYLGVCLYAAARTLARRDQVIFTRDIMVAAVVTALGGLTVYEAHNYPKGLFVSYLMKALAKLPNFKLVAVCGALGSYYQKHYGIPDNRILVAHNGVFPEDYEEVRTRPKSQLRKELGLPLDMTLVVHTGSLYKGGAELFGSVVEGRNNLCFVHVGGSIEEINKWESYYRIRGLTGIKFIPHLPHQEIKKYQCSADILFYVSTEDNPIYWCTSPLKLFEYIGAGCPIFGSNIGSVSEILNETNAYCFAPDGLDSLNAAYLEYTDDLNNGSVKLIDSSLHTWHSRAKSIDAFL